MAAGDLKTVSIRREVAREILKGQFTLTDVKGGGLRPGTELILDNVNGDYLPAIQNADQFIINQGNGIAFANIAIPVPAGAYIGSIILRRTEKGTDHDLYVIELMPETQQEIDSLYFENAGILYITSLLFEFKLTFS